MPDDAPPSPSSRSFLLEVRDPTDTPGKHVVVARHAVRICKSTGHVVSDFEAVAPTLTFWLRQKFPTP